ncbi:putative capsid protein [Cyanoramphus nest associated circular X DNA virus]|uniref:Putative capsid protein n=1 Tax=Cyanoramphus nest associated circular X DNA virus TaxID=1282443 RepID=L7UX06_9VIRU|nr:putative capsid protein [Cyanoramphus nest associated circular X DNA virus]AGC55147.1 putative capsid protein [Cyanoramphus nest associated circular X DNA virus]
MGRKRAAPWAGKSYGKRRRVIRRRRWPVPARKRRVPKRRSRRTRKTTRDNARVYRQGLFARFIGPTYTLSAAANEDAVYTLNFNYGTLGQNDFAKQMEGYARMFEQMKCYKAKLTYWLNDNDELAKPETKWTEVVTSYDPRNYARNMTFQGALSRGNSKRVILKPGRKYTATITPKWGVNLAAADVPAPSDPSVVQVGGRSGYVNMSRVALATDISINSLCMVFHGMPAETDFLSCYNTFYCHFKDRVQMNPYKL